MSLPAIATNATGRAPDERTVLRLNIDGRTVEIWRNGELVGAIEPTPAGLRIQLGDADPGGGPVLMWPGDPFSLRFDLTGGDPC